MLRADHRQDRPLYRHGGFYSRASAKSLESVHGHVHVGESDAQVPPGQRHGRAQEEIISGSHGRTGRNDAEARRGADAVC